MVTQVDGSTGLVEKVMVQEDEQPEMEPEYGPDSELYDENDENFCAENTPSWHENEDFTEFPAQDTENSEAV